MKKRPLVSIITVSYNSEKFLNHCLASIYQSTFQDFEVIVVDNGSFDRSVESLKKKFLLQSNFKLVKLKKNLGSSAGRNRGVRRAQGKYLLFLDPDTVVKKDCLTQMIAFFQDHPYVGGLHAKLLNLEKPDFYDHAGECLDSFGFLVDRAKGRKDTGDLDYVAPVLGGKTAALMTSREVYDQVQGFDEDYFFLLEDGDFDWKIWLMGHPVLFLPQAVVYHAFHGEEKTQNKERYYFRVPLKYYGARNYLLTLIKNLGNKKLIKIVPLHLFCWSTMAFLFLLKGRFKVSGQIIKGLGWNFINLPLVLRKRRQLQKRRLVSDSEINFLFIPRENLNHYLVKIVSYLND